MYVGGGWGGVVVYNLTHRFDILCTLLVNKLCLTEIHFCKQYLKSE